MRKIIIHWTAGTGSPNSTDKMHYHYLINDRGEITNGLYKPEDNENCSDGRYAQHTGGGNTGSIGVAFCGMCGFSSNTNVGKYPLTKKQCEAGFKFIAQLALKYNIAITPQTVMTHYEFGLKNPKTSSAGKIDIVYLPPYPTVSKSQVGDFIRNKIHWYKLREVTK